MPWHEHLIARTIVRTLLGFTAAATINIGLTYHGAYSKEQHQWQM